MLVLKRFSLEAATGRGLKDVGELADYALLGSSDEASPHPHVLAARLVFAYWIASGEPHRDEKGEPYRKVKIRGELAVFYEDRPTRARGPRRARPAGGQLRVRGVRRRRPAAGAAHAGGRRIPLDEKI